MILRSSCGLDRPKQTIWQSSIPYCFQTRQVRANAVFCGVAQETVAAMQAVWAWPAPRLFHKFVAMRGWGSPGTDDFVQRQLTGIDHL